jgi:phage terminase small subunit
MAKKEYKWTPADEKFCEHYFEYGNQTQAALFAFGDKRVDPKGITYETAKNKGSEMMTYPHILEYIEQLKEEFSAQFKQNKEKTVRDLITSAEEAKKAGQFVAYAKIRDMVIKMEGFYEPEKHSHVIEFDVQIPGLDNLNLEKEEDGEEEGND